MSCAYTTDNYGAVADAAGQEGNGKHDQFASSSGATALAVIRKLMSWEGKKVLGCICYKHG